MPSMGDHHENDPRFVSYYAATSSTDRARDRAIGIMKAVLRSRAARSATTTALAVADIGCNAGTQSQCWLEAGHKVRGIDISRELVAIAAERNQRFGAAAMFEVGSATALPWDNERFDICILPELLEHVDDWQSCLNEAVRVLKPGGSLYLSTTNVLCPVQDEFNLPVYSWYPAFLKAHFVNKARTDNPAVANFATFPAVHWFSPYSLKRFLQPLGVTVQDRFDLIDLAGRGSVARLAVESTRKIPPMRFLGHVLTSNTIIVGHKCMAGKKRDQ